MGELYKLANVVLDVDEHARLNRELYYRSDENLTFSKDGKFLSISSPVDFTTYINGFSAYKWNKYTGIVSLVLHLCYCGHATLVIQGVPTGDTELHNISTQRLASNHQACADIKFSIEEYDIVGFYITPDGDSPFSLFSASYCTPIGSRNIHHVSLAVATTTFNNERYILPNIELVKAGIAHEGGRIAANFHMFVVDNGKSLDADRLSDDVVTIIPNPNVGGSGGFARGMLAATEKPDSFTHVIVMDDDVRILPESIIRVFNLLSLVRGKYKDAFLNGAMLSLEMPTRQFEDVAHVVKNGTYRRIKGDIDASTLTGMLDNERIDVEVPNAYGAWWFSCIPVSAILENGLPMPFFIRCDDVEFGVRNQPVYMTMNGICVWHAGFEGRYRASVDCYQYTRNFLATIASTGGSSEFLAMLRLRRSIRLQLRDLDYVSAERYLDGLEDYLKGPEYLASIDGSLIMKEKGALNERQLDISEIDQQLLDEAGVSDAVLKKRDLSSRPPKILRLLRSLPYDKHYLPDFALRRRAGYVVKNVSMQLEGNSMRCKTIICLDATREHAVIRHMDRKRFKEIHQRERALMSRYRKSRKTVRKAWRDARPHLTSSEFWINYLENR